MAKNQVVFFAIDDDLAGVLAEVSERQSFGVVGTELSEGVSPTAVVLERIPRLSVSKYGNQAADPVYLLVRPDVIPVVRTVTQRNGKERRILDQQSHPESVVLRPGGTFGDCVIAGQIGTISNDPWSVSLFRLLRASLKGRFERIRSYEVGPAAGKALMQGCRLTTSIKAPREYDLAR